MTVATSAADGVAHALPVLLGLPERPDDDLGATHAVTVDVVGQVHDAAVLYGSDVACVEAQRQHAARDRFIAESDHVELAAPPEDRCA